METATQRPQRELASPAAFGPAAMVRLGALRFGLGLPRGTGESEGTPTAEHLLPLGSEPALASGAPRTAAEAPAEGRSCASRHAAAPYRSRGIRACTGRRGSSSRHRTATGIAAVLGKGFCQVWGGRSWRRWCLSTSSSSCRHA